MANLISWFEIPASDFDRAMNFYSKVFGLKIDVNIFNSARHGVIRSENLSGAIVESGPVTANSNSPLLYFKVVDMALALSKITQLGGKIVKEKSIIRDQTPDGKSVIPKTQIDGAIGYFSLFIDSEGNRLGLYSNS